MAYNTMLLNGFGFCPVGAYNTDYDSESNDSTPQGDIEKNSTSHNQ